jgi:hypothetical protein
MNARNLVPLLLAYAVLSGGLTLGATFTSAFFWSAGIVLGTWARRLWDARRHGPAVLVLAIYLTCGVFLISR